MTYRLEKNDPDIVGKPCPTCTFFGITEKQSGSGVLFWQSNPGFYECDYAEHYFDVDTLGMILQLVQAVPPPAQTDQPAEQADQANGDSQTQSDVVMILHNQGGSNDIYFEGEIGRWVKKTTWVQYLSDNPFGEE